MNRLNRLKHDTKHETDPEAKKACMVEVMKFIVETEDFAIRWYGELKELLPEYADVIDEIRNDEIDHKRKDEIMLKAVQTKHVPSGKVEYKWIRILAHTNAITSDQDMKRYGPYCSGTEVKVPVAVGTALIGQKQAQWLQ